jgi:hypothetical protein
MNGVLVGQHLRLEKTNVRERLIFTGLLEQ